MNSEQSLFLGKSMRLPCFMVDTFVEYFDTLTIRLIAIFFQISDSNDKYYCGPDYAAVKHNVA